jgi:hypothetical protein
MGKPCSTCIDLVNGCGPVKTDDVIYTGPKLPCSTINTNDTLTLAFQKIDALLCAGGGGGVDLSYLASPFDGTILNSGGTPAIIPLADSINAGLLSPGDFDIIQNIESDIQAILTQSITDGDITHAPSSDAVFDALAALESVISDILTQSVTDGDTTHAPSSDAVFDAISAAVIGSLFDADIPVVLSGVKTLGKYVSGQTIPAIGKTAQQVLTDIALEYINPAFTSFTVAGQPTTVEVGTGISGSKTFNWSVLNNSGVVSTIDLYDNTAGATLLAGTPNDGTQAQTVNSIALNGDGATQSWKAIANNTSPVGVINSNNFVITARFSRWWAPVASYPVNPLDAVANRTYALGLTSAFKTPGTNTFTLVTGTTQIRFIVLLPPGITIVSVIDQTNANTNITANYLLSAITINDAGGTPRNYNMYQYTNAIPYTLSANHFITTT